MNNKFLIFVFALFFFTDPTVFFRVIVGNDIASVILVLIFILIITIKCLKIGRTKLFTNRYKKEFYLVLAYIILSTSVHIFLGQDLNYLIQHEIIVIQCLFLFILLIEPKYQKSLLYAYFFASFIHLITIFPIFSFLTSNLSENTAYGEGEYSVGVFSRRATGFFNSPGQLSLFALGALPLGFYFIKQKQNKIGILLLVNATVLGIAALSRSFFVASLFVILIYTFKSSIMMKVKFIFIFMILIVILSTNETFLSYYDLIHERLSTIFSSSDNDRLSGETGLFEVIKVVENYPLFGNPILVDGKAMLAWNGEMEVRPHTGLLVILCFYGFVFGFPIYYLVFRGFKIIFKELLLLNSKKINNRIRISENPFLYGFIAVFVLTLVEPLLEHPIFFLFLFGMMHYYKQRFDYEFNIDNKDETNKKTT